MGGPPSVGVRQASCPATLLAGTKGGSFLELREKGGGHDRYLYKDHADGDRYLLGPADSEADRARCQQAIWAGLRRQPPSPLPCSPPAIDLRKRNASTNKADGDIFDRAGSGSEDYRRRRDNRADNPNDSHNSRKADGCRC
jgi:hypothetical protein